MIKGLTAGKLLVIGLLLAVAAITVLGIIYRSFTEDLVPLPTPTPVSSPAGATSQGDAGSLALRRV